MNAMRVPPSRGRRGFTLVEILTVIVIIGILSALAIPAVTRAIATGKTAKMRMEVGAIEQAIERYRDKYGDYPPDFSSWPVVESHYRKLFPRIAPEDINRLRLLTDVDPSNDTAVSPPSPWLAHGGARMDRAEALVWTLGGYSNNPINPFTGPGGPLELIATSATAVVYQINIDRPEKIYDFDPARLDLSKIASDAPVSAANRYVSTGDGDLFPSYAVNDEGAPFVYFDSRTYTLFDANLGFNGYVDPLNTNNVVRPYYSELQVANTTGTNYGTLADALKAWQFMKPDTFQVIAPGLDGIFGSTPNYDFDLNVTGLEPLYFQYPTGRAIAPLTAAATPGDLLVPGVRAYQESAKFGVLEDFQLDNVANFSRAKLIDDLQE